MVREPMQPDRSIAEVGRLYGVNQNQLSRWIREYRDGAAWSGNDAILCSHALTPLSDLAHAASHHGDDPTQSQPTQPNPLEFATSTQPLPTVSYIPVLVKDHRDKTALGSPD